MDNLQPQLQSDDDDDMMLMSLLPLSSSFTSPPAPMQMSNAYYDDLDFDHGDGGTLSRHEAISEDEDFGPPKRKRFKAPHQFLGSHELLKVTASASLSSNPVKKTNGFESPEEGEISDDPDVDADSELTVSRISRNEGESDKTETENFVPNVLPAENEFAQFSSSSAMAYDELEADDVVSGSCSSLFVSGIDNQEKLLQNDEPFQKDSLNVQDNEFEIIDDALSSDNGDDATVGEGGGVYSEDESEGDVEVDDDEIEAMLEERMTSDAVLDGDGKRKVSEGRGKSFPSGGVIDFQAPSMLQKVILVERGQDPFDILPEGWLIVTHQSGMPIYLHKPTRVCTVSRPYFLGPGSARKHEIPLSAIPCLQYRQAMSNESVGGKDQAETASSDDPALDGPGCAPSSGGVQGTANEPGQEQNIVNGETNNTTSVVPTPDARKIAIPAKVQSAEDHKKSNSLTPLEFRAYCQRLFGFKTITVRRFRRWKDRRKHNILLKKASRPTLPPSTNLITCAIPADKESHSSFRRKAFVLNPAGKSPVCILHEYAQHTMRIQPRYIFQELENSQMPYSATVVISEVQYGTGYATSKKMAKLEAARITLKILIPEIGKVKTDEQIEDLSYFDEIKIEDPRVVDLCTKAGHPTPYQILGECLKRNYGMGDTQVQMDINTVKHQRSEFIMRVGRHEAKVICKNKREGKQQAAQAILQMMHPHIHTWGSLLRLYAKANEIKDKREEEHSVTKLQTMAHPNKAILEKLRQEMTKLYHKQDAFQSNIRGKLKVAAPEMVSSELQAVDL